MIFSSSIQKENTMSITETKNGTYRLRVYIPEEVKSSLGVDKKVIEKRFKIRNDAKKYELELQNKFDKIRSGDSVSLENSGSILFSDFYQNVWWESYKAGQTTSTTKPPSQATIVGTEIAFRKHILPLLGNYSIDFLNQNKQVVLNLLTQKAEEYANFKVIRSYVNSIFDWAEELEYIETNRLSKTISRIKATKKIKLQESKKDEDLYLSQEELQAWFTAFEKDLETEKILFKDYVLFYTTFFLSDRKSETYALQWKHINFEKNEILIEQALDKFGNLKSTKGNKKTLFKAPKELMNILTVWKIEQKKQLKLFGIKQNEKQFVFTYNNRKNGINVPLHIDYLNHRMNTIRRRHPELPPASPHKLRHTGATLARRAGISLNAISEALTHSDIQITKTYVNTTETVNQTAGEIAFRSLKKQ